MLFLYVIGKSPFTYTQCACCIYVNVAEFRQQLRMERFFTSSGHVTEYSS